MADILDCVFLFFMFLAGGVVFFGGIYEKHIKDKLAKTSSKQQAQTKLPQTTTDRWSEGPYTSTKGAGYYSESPPHTNSSQIYNTYQPPHQSWSCAPDIWQTDDQSGYQSGVAANREPTYRASERSPTSCDPYATFTPGAQQDHKSQAWRYGDESLGNDNLWHATERQDTNSIIPTATGFNSDCVEWVNSILLLFYSQSDKYGPIIAESIYRSLSEKLSNILSLSPDNLVFEFRPSTDNARGSSLPELTNFRTESESDKSVSAICKIYNKRFIFDLSIQKGRGPIGQLTTALDDDQYAASNLSDSPTAGTEVALYELTLENLEGKLKSVAMLNDKLIVVQFMEKPDTKILLRPKYRSQAAATLINEDTLVSLILQNLTQVVVDLYFGDDPDFPVYKQPQAPSYKSKLNLLKGSASEIKRQIKQDFFGALSLSSSPPPAADKERKIFIKIVRAKNINYNQSVTCVLEMDQPYQQALSSTRQGSSPSWDEHFMFFVTEKSNELLIELWDSITLPKEVLPSKKSAKGSQPNLSGQQKWSKAEVVAGAKFLGLARISIDELRKNPVQKVNLMLVSKEFSADLSNSVGGELQVELLFLEHSSTPGGSSGVKKSSSLSSIAHQPGDVVSVDRKLTQSGYVITTTTITKPNKIGRHPSAGRYDQLSVRNQPSPISTEFSEMDTNLDGISSQMGDLRSASPSNAEGGQQEDDPARPRRGRSRSRSFLRAIKKRFSFSRTRSRSVGERGDLGSVKRQSQSALGDALDTGSIESRSRASSEVSLSGRAKSVPVSRDPSEVPTIVINKGRLSDAGSAFTFANPKSQLVIECAEPKMKADGTVQPRGQIRYYAINDESASKWRRRGVKLHLFNEHLFMACHLAGSSTCHLCGRVFSRRPGKQGYKCRNCHLLSHKQCHTKVDHNCPYALGDSLKLEFIDADPPAQLMELAQQHQSSDDQQVASQATSGTLPRQSNRSLIRQPAKSTSMDIDDR